MRRLLSLLSLAFCIQIGLFAQSGDTIVVETFSFADPSPIGFSAPYRGTFDFPDTTEKFAKVLMAYTLKCDPATAQDGFECGEWDYLTYTYVYDSTAWFDSTFRTHPNFRIGGTTPDSIRLNDSPNYEFYHNWQYRALVSDTNSVSLAAVGNGVSGSTEPFNGSAALSRTQYLWRASELSNAGLTAGMINGLQMDLSAFGSDLGYFSIRLKHTALDSLSPESYEADGFQTVYSYNLDLTNAMIGWQSFVFTNPFSWDGSSNVVVEFTHENAPNGNDAQVFAETPSFDAGIYTVGNEHFLSFRGPDYVKVDPTNIAPLINDEITVSCWVYGDPNVQPQSDNLFEARDANNRRVFSVHLPWGNGQVYWDAGNSGTASYDRINKVADPNVYRGSWHHWAFTKSALTGEMNIYIDGQLWHSGVGKTRTMSGITGFNIGSNRNNAGNYDGYIDEFRVWNTALDGATIQEWMNRSVNSTHPQYNNLVSYFPFDEGEGTQLIDQSSLQNTAEIKGFPDWRSPLPEQLNRNWQTTSLRPNIRFDQSDYVFTLDSMLVVDSVALMPSEILIYGNDANGTLVFDGSPNHPSTPTDTLLQWEAGDYTYTYDRQTGAKLDSIPQAFTQTLYRDDIQYYSNVVRYEIGRYITPYGIGLDLGPEGKTWYFDITDYAPLLHDAVRLQAGNNQELLDLKFIMIKGTPPRDVHKIENLWNGSFSYASLVDDTRGAPIAKQLDPKGSMFQVKTRTTGHGFGGPTNCAEFCPRNHYLNINGNREYSWYLWNECSDNFIYPQGGTWIYDRAGWCPGAKVSTYEHELTGRFNPGDSVRLDYDLQLNGQPEGNYVLEAQLFTYGVPNFGREVEISEIVAPSNKDEFSRLNPVCDNPTIRVRNLGADTVRSIKFKYGVENGFTPCWYVWEGSLNFLEESEIDLPRFNWTGLDQNNPQFYVEILEVNGQADDERTNNNRLQTAFETVPEYLPKAIIEVQTNNAGHENSYRIYDKDGNVVKLQLGFGNNFNYRDTLNLPEGCYTFHFLDTGQDGIDWWANSDGSGFVRIINPNGGFHKLFEPDYGKDIWHQFTVGYQQGVEIPDVQCDESVSNEAELEEFNSIYVYPNPNKGSFKLDVSLGQSSEIEVSVMNSLGMQVYQARYPRTLSQVYDLDLGLSAGIYFVKINTTNSQYIRSIVVQ
ncbi:MAG: LamG-like jellyroll fold domain-containing protein [Bacteroidota bacterium]